MLSLVFGGQVMSRMSQQLETIQGENQRLRQTLVRMEHNAPMARARIESVIGILRASGHEDAVQTAEFIRDHDLPPETFEVLGAKLTETRKTRYDSDPHTKVAV